MTLPNVEARISGQLRRTASAPTSGFVWPTRSRVITQGVTAKHVALDVRAGLGAPLYSLTNAVVERVVPLSQRSSYGNLLVLRLATGEKAYYAHLSRFAVRPGQQVKAGQLVGYAGSTYGPGGFSSAPHLHLEFRSASGAKLDPNAVLARLGQGIAPVDSPSLRISGSTMQRVSTISPATMVGQATITRAGTQELMPPSTMLEMQRAGRGPSVPAGESLSGGWYAQQQLKAADKRAEAEQEGLPLLNLPLGQKVSLATKLSWPNLLAIGVGIVVVVGSIWQMTSGARAEVWGVAKEWLKPEAVGKLAKAAVL